MQNIQVNNDISFTVMASEGLPDYNLEAYFIVPASWSEMLEFGGTEQYVTILRVGIIGRAVSNKKATIFTGYQAGGYSIANLPAKEVSIDLLAQQYMANQEGVKKNRAPNSVVVVHNPRALPIEGFLPEVLQTYLDRLRQKSPEQIASLEKQVLEDVRKRYNIFSREGLDRRLHNKNFKSIYGTDSKLIEMTRGYNSHLPSILKVIIS